MEHQKSTQRVIADKQVQQAIDKEWTVVAKIEGGVVVQKALSLDQILKLGVEKAKQIAAKKKI